MSSPALLCSGGDFAQMADDLLGSGCHIRFCVRGWSMHPFIQDGDLLTVEPLGGKTPRVGDVLLCQGERGRLYAHRLIRSGQAGTLTTKGDHALYFDKPIDLASVLGRVTAIENGAGSASLTGLRGRLLARAWGWLSPVSAWLRPHLRRHRWLLALLPRP